MGDATAVEIITAAELITPDDYTTELGKRWAAHRNEWVTVTEIRLAHTGGQLAGYIVAGDDNHVFGMAECTDGSSKSVAHCILDTASGREHMIASVIAVWADSWGGN